jgi:hypothetical protein
MKWTMMLKLWGKGTGKTWPGIDKSGRIFYGRLWPKKGCSANDDDEDICFP